jgi:hypothetical protein
MKAKRDYPDRVHSDQMVLAWDSQGLGGLDHTGGGPRQLKGGHQV